MTIHEFGKDNKEVILLIHPSLVLWDYFEYVIPLLESRYHLIVPAVPGYDEEEPGDFTSVERIASDLADQLKDRGIQEIACMYGCSMGGSIVTRFLADDRIRVKCAVLDGGITPYQLPWILTRFIAIRDYLMIMMGKVGGIRVLEKAFSTDEYSEEDLKYVEKVLKFISRKTIWRTFDSCNNYKMPEVVRTDCSRIEYWYASSEAKDRKWDIKYIKKIFPETEFRVFENLGHGGMAVLKPELMAAEIERIIEEE